MDVTHLDLPAPQRTWRLKLAMKIVAGSIGVPYSWLRYAGLGRHGEMLDPDYALDVVRTHVGDHPLDGAVALEIGPGDSVSSGIVTAAMGATRTWLVDVGSFADLRPETYRPLWARLVADGIEGAGLQKRLPGTAEELLTAARITYLTDGVASLASVPDGCIDVAWSHAVLEHVRREELAGLFAELRRVLRPGAQSSHRVDLRDHLSGGLKNLTFRSERWERPAVWRSGAYTNRLSLTEIVEAAREAGLVVDVGAVDRWPNPPVGRSELAPEFRDRSFDDLRVAAFDLKATAP